MTRFQIDVAGPADARDLADLLNQVVAESGNTEIVGIFTRQAVLDWMGHEVKRTNWLIARSDDGDALGFQWIGPWGDLPPDVCEIATIIDRSKTGLGIGSALFRITEYAARALGFSYINVEIRIDDMAIQAYYQSRGFEDYGSKKEVELADGTKIEKIIKRFNLKR